MWFRLLAVLLHCRDWRDQACKSTPKKVLAHILHYRENAIIVPVFPLLCPWTKPLRTAPTRAACVCVIRSLVYRTCWRGEREGEQRCWLNSVKPVSLCAQFVGSAGYFQKQPHLEGKAGCIRPVTHVPACQSTYHKPEIKKNKKNKQELNDHLCFSFPTVWQKNGNYMFLKDGGIRRVLCLFFLPSCLTLSCE